MCSTAPIRMGKYTPQYAEPYQLVAPYTQHPTRPKGMGRGGVGALTRALEVPDPAYQDIPPDLHQRVPEHIATGS